MEAWPSGLAGERVHLLFVIAVPRRLVNDYLVCVGALARVVQRCDDPGRPPELRDRI